MRCNIKISNEHKIFYFNKKLNIENKVCVHTLINYQNKIYDSFLTDKMTAYAIISALHKRLDRQKLLKRLEWLTKNGATRELKKASARTLRKLQS